MKTGLNEMLILGRALLVSALMMLSLCALAEQKQTPVEEFHGATAYGSFMCKLQLTIKQDQVEIGQAEYQEQFQAIPKCIAEFRPPADAAYRKATKTLKSQDERKSLKAYYAAWLSSLKGMEPGSDEIKLDYSRRQRASDAKLEDLWAQFEVDAGP